jgi:hypothetical protein
MNFLNPRSYLQQMRRYWLVLVAILFFVFAMTTNAPAWAASVPGSANQTVPPGGTVPPVDNYFPFIKLRD